MRAAVEPFSAGYFLVNADVVEYTGHRVVMPHDFFDELVNHVTRPLLRINDAHYWPIPEASLPADTVAVPKDLSFEEGAPVLLAKDNTTLRLIESGQERAPA